MTNPGLSDRQNTVYETDDQMQSFPLMDYLQHLWFRKKLILAITAFVAVFGFIKVNEIVDLYSAQSTLMIGLPEAFVLEFDGVMDRSSWGDAESEIEILRSDVLMTKVVRRLNLVNHPEFNSSLRVDDKQKPNISRYFNPLNWIPNSWKTSVAEALGFARKSPVAVSTEPATMSLTDSESLLLSEEEAKALEFEKSVVRALKGKISFKAMGYSNVINIQVTTRDPQLAAEIANDVPEAYMLDKLESRFEATQKANAWLTEQLGELEANVAESERAVIMYREEHGLGEGQGTTILDAQLSETKSQLIIARAEKAEIDARLSQLNRLLSGGGMGVETASEVMSSALVQQLRTHFYLG